LLLSLLVPGPGQAAEAPLFSDDSVMELTLPLDFSDLCHPRDNRDCEYSPTVLEYLDAEGQTRSIPVEVRIRGGWRSLDKNCSAHLLFIRFDEASSAGTPFEGQTVLPLTTHCGQGLSLNPSGVRSRRSDWEHYLLREYLAHRLYNQVTDYSLKARLLWMTYPDPDRPSRKIRNHAFFTEHFLSLARREGAELLERGSFDAAALDLQAANRLALFELMIGNTDWSIVRQRNIILLQRTDGTHVPVPYDFDMSGLVDAHYAGPAPGLPIEKVRDRYYLGYCSEDTDWSALIDSYLESEQEILAVIGASSGMDKHERKRARRYLEEFFEILRDPEQRQREIIENCRPWPPATGTPPITKGR
jgi:hypothetical protein